MELLLYCYRYAIFPLPDQRIPRLALAYDVFVVFAKRKGSDQVFVRTRFCPFSIRTNLPNDINNGRGISLHAAISSTILHFIT
jgi:hypothetical protein